ncbi:uncharacterized protein LOC124139769 isoform X2 [Haliotis rufescens]|uniref:uncharacterized protein LOC124139769 isoform X2 n=1 Tax=Haliotis rufescens TaxID=6454 RepID=UPI001EB09774|nr:uncharacterized protein LOC124139769 isoform X2 [Haliotis rufescens]
MTRILVYTYTPKAHTSLTTTCLKCVPRGISTCLLRTAMTMLEELRKVYSMAIIETLVTPVLGSADNIDELRVIVLSGLVDFEDRVKQCGQTDDVDMETGDLGLSPFESFKHRLRDMEDYLKHKFRERTTSRQTSLLNGSLKSNDSDGNAVKQALRQSYPRLVEGLCLNGTTLLNQLIQDNCLDDNDVDSISTKPTDRRKNQQLLRLISTQLSSDKIVDVFIPALRAEHAHLADAFCEALRQIQSPAVKQCPYCRLTGTVDPRGVAEALYSKSLIMENCLRDFVNPSLPTIKKWKRILDLIQDATLIIDTLQNNYSELYEELKALSGAVQIHWCTCSLYAVSTNSSPGYNDTISVFSGETTLTPSIPAYQMKSSTRGICAIINNTDTHAADTQKVDDLFTRLGFTVERITNLTKRHMLFRLEEIASRDHTSHDAFVCAILLGGTDKDHVCDISMESVHIGYLVQPFRALSCRTLAGKPKVFLIPYGSGLRRQPGLVIREAVPHSLLETRRTVVPEDADILYARGTPPGYHTSHCKTTGSWYLNNLVEVMDRHCDTMDFVTCLGMVNEGVGKVDYTKHDITYTQTTHIMSTLRKVLYFTKRPRSRSMQEESDLEREHSPRSNVQDARP